MEESSADEVSLLVEIDEGELEVTFRSPEAIFIKLALEEKPKELH